MRREEEQLVVMDDYRETITIKDVRDSLQVAAIAGTLFPPVIVLLSLLPFVRHSRVIGWIGMGYLFLALMVGEVFADKPGVHFWMYLRYEVLAGVMFGTSMVSSMLLMWFVVCRVLGRTQMFLCYSLPEDLEFGLLMAGIYIVLSASTYLYEHTDDKKNKEE